MLISAAKHLGSPEAAAEFEKIHSLNTKLPAEYYYYYGKHLYKTVKLKEAYKNIEKYIEKADRDGQFYRYPLQLMTAIEQEQKKLRETRSSRTRGSEAAIFAFNGGFQNWRPRSYSSYYRALPLRRAK